MNNSIAFVTTCKGRLQHIKETLPLIVAQSPDEVVVVDYACPDRVGDWVEANYPQVKVVRVTDDRGFCVARARNRGAAQTQSPWICFIDADIKIQMGWLNWMRVNLDKRFFYRASGNEGARATDTWGTCICHRTAFEKLEGFDEVFRGWGGEDDDLYRRLFMLGIAEASYPAEYVVPILHDDQLRTVFYAEKLIDIHHCINRFYLEAKNQMMFLRLNKIQPPLDVRLALMEKIKAELKDWQPGELPLPTISFSAKGVGWMPEPYHMTKQLQFTLSIEQDE
jgi:glycosyltransferase involved in cell wall biosynthesis